MFNDLRLFRFTCLVARLAVCSVGLACHFLGEQAFAQGIVAISNVRIETAGPDGTIENGTILVRDGKIADLGKEVKVPISARIIDGAGRTVTPGFVDPYYVVSIERNTGDSATRTVVFGGRVFVIGGGSPAIATTFAKVADGLDFKDVNWNVARRSGITTMHVVTGGYAQSLVAEMTEESAKLLDADGDLHVTLTNDTPSLDVLRAGLKGTVRPSSPAASTGGARPGFTRGGLSESSEDVVETADETPAPAAPTQGSARPTSSSPTQSLWSSVRDGKSPLFINVNNASSILHADTILNEYDKVKVALVASGGDTFLTLDDLEPKTYTLVLSPAIDLIPNSRNRINIPKLLADRKIEFAFSLSLGQSDYRTQQPAPLFAVAMLVRSGLNRDLALRSLTSIPAKLLGIDKEVGSIEKGKKANMVLFDGDPFATTTAIDQILIEGKPIYEN